MTHLSFIQTRARCVAVVTARAASGDKTKAIVGKPNWARSQ